MKRKPIVYGLSSPVEGGSEPSSVEGGGPSQQRNTSEQNAMLALSKEVDTFVEAIFQLKQRLEGGNSLTNKNVSSGDPVPPK